MIDHFGNMLPNQERWDAFLTQNGIVDDRHRKIASATLNEALKRIHKNKDELFLVLKRPDMPLHNNSAENAIREYVKRRKINGSTRSKLGRRARDTFTSLKKTCRKLAISFCEYLEDRIENNVFLPAVVFANRTRGFKARVISVFL